MLKIIKYIFIVVLGLLLLLVGTTTILYWGADMKQPQVTISLADYPVTEGAGYLECRGNYLRQSESGLYEAYLHGSPIERGTALGRLSGNLLYEQESAFVNQIREIIPSDSYLRFLRYLLVAFNRNLGEHVPPEFREEIYGISLSCTDEFDAIGTPYERQLNYHAAHDIGHTMQDYMLVGCSSFGVWGSEAVDSTLIIGRNFDFWVGDDFAKNKLVAFYAPADGYRFASVTWPGMTGVLSGMNEKGLTVSLNAAKGPLPTSSATPISVLAREILQYASDIGEALQIARNRQTFVSESLLIGSAADGCAAIIEKTPGRTELKRSGTNSIVCTNHFQSDAFAEDEYNLENIATSDSPYRFARIEELLDEAEKPLGPSAAASILRDRYGLGGKDIGLTNEKSINQSIAHHSVVFRPAEGLMWVSAGPWQSGRYICYDLNRIFSAPDFSGEIYREDLSLPADSAFMARDYARVVHQREWAQELKTAASGKHRLDDSFIEKYTANNPEYYYVWSSLGDYYRAVGEKDAAMESYRQALLKEIPRQGEREEIARKLKKLEP